jgi:hypothetical protein
MWQCAIQPAGPGELEEDVDRLARPHQHGVLPDQVGRRLVVACEHQEAAGAVHVERVVHRVIAVHRVEQAELDAVAHGEGPVDGGVLSARLVVDELPEHVGRIRDGVKGR